jgi:DNA-binding response OmpR family regulator
VAETHTPPYRTRLLLVEDEEGLAVPVERGLEEEGYHVDVALDGEQGLKQALTVHYDLLIVDWRLPGIDGRTLVERLRSAKIPTPVLMLTALHDVDHRIAGLDSGADDYLTKPFVFEELLARLRALRRRTQDVDTSRGRPPPHEYGTAHGPPGRKEAGSAG